MSTDETRQSTENNLHDYWLSWYCQTPMNEFELHSPWWISGYGSDDSFIIVAAVRAESEDAAFAQVKTAYDNEPEGFRQRFIEPLTNSPFSGRFPQANWMRWAEEGTCACDVPTCPERPTPSAEERSS